jgi:hypothetical protein
MASPGSATGTTDETALLKALHRLRSSLDMLGCLQREAQEDIEPWLAALCAMLLQRQQQEVAARRLRQRRSQYAVAPWRLQREAQEDIEPLQAWAGPMRRQRSRSHSSSAFRASHPPRGARMRRTLGMSVPMCQCHTCRRLANVAVAAGPTGRQDHNTQLEAMCGQLDRDLSSIAATIHEAARSLRHTVLIELADDLSA